MKDQFYYDEVASELANKFVKPGLWARAVAETGREGSEARALYIRLRVAELKESAVGSTRAETENRPILKDFLKPVQNAPSLTRINGTGLTLLGKLFDPAIAPLYFKRCYYTFLWLPISPAKIYLVKNTLDAEGEPLPSAYEFHGELNMESLRKLYDKESVRAFSRSVLSESATDLGFVIVGIFVIALIVALVHSCSQ